MAQRLSTVGFCIHCRAGRGWRENITRCWRQFSPGLPGGRHISYGFRVLERKPWEAEAVLALLMGLFLIFGMGGIVASVLPRPASNGTPAPSTTETASPAVASPKPAFSAFVLGTLTFHGAVLLLVHRFVRMHRVRWSDAFGWRRSGVSRALGAGVTVAPPGP